MNEEFVKKIIEIAKHGTFKSTIISLAANYGVKQKDVGKHIKEARKHGLYNVKIAQHDVYYQCD